MKVEIQLGVALGASTGCRIGLEGLMSRRVPLNGHLSTQNKIWCPKNQECRRNLLALNRHWYLRNRKVKHLRIHSRQIEIQPQANCQKVLERRKQSNLRKQNHLSIWIKILKIIIKFGFQDGKWFDWDWPHSVAGHVTRKHYWDLSEKQNTKFTQKSILAVS